jgi:hypothetical protein
VAIAGQSHGRVVVARSAPEILSAGDAKRKATSNFAAFRRQEDMQTSPFARIMIKRQAKSSRIGFVLPRTIGKVVS